MKFNIFEDKIIKLSDEELKECQGGFKIVNINRNSCTDKVVDVEVSGWLLFLGSVMTIAFTGQIAGVIKAYIRHRK